jgi:hypothetical protein
MLFFPLAISFLRAPSLAYRWADGKRKPDLVTVVFVNDIGANNATWFFIRDPKHLTTEEQAELSRLLHWLPE